MERAASFEYVWPLEFDPENPYRFPIARTVWRVADEDSWIIHPVELSGSIEWTGDLQGPLSIGPTPLYLIGSIGGLGALGGDLTNGYLLTGGIAGVGEFGGALSLAWNLVGNVSGNAALTGSLLVEYSLAGSIAGTGTLAGTVAIIEPRPSALLLAIR